MEKLAEITAWTEEQCVSYLNLKEIKEINDVLRCLNEVKKPEHTSFSENLKQLMYDYGFSPDGRRIGGGYYDFKILCDHLSKVNKRLREIRRNKPKKAINHTYIPSSTEEFMEMIRENLNN